MPESVPESQETEETPVVEGASVSALADERKKRVLLRLAHLVSCRTEGSIAVSPGFGSSEIMAIARSVSPKIVKGILRASELLLNKMSTSGKYLFGISRKAGL